MNVDTFRVDPAVEESLSTMVDNFIIDPTMKLLVTVDDMSREDINDITQAFVHSSRKSKPIQHTVCFKYPNGAQRVFHLNGKNQVSQMTIHKTVKVRVQDRCYSLVFTQYSIRNMTKKKKYSTTTNATSVILYATNTFIFNNWIYETQQILEGPTKQKAAESKAKFSIRLTPFLDRTNLTVTQGTLLFLNRGLDLLGRYSSEKCSSLVSLFTNDTH